MDVQPSFSFTNDPFKGLVSQLKNMTDAVVMLDFCSRLEPNHCFTHNAYWNLPKCKQTADSLMMDVAIASFTAQESVLNLSNMIKRSDSSCIPAAISALNQIFEHTKAAEGSFEKHNTLSPTLKSDLKGIYFGNLTNRVAEAIQSLNLDIQQQAPRRKVLPPSELATRAPSAKAASVRPATLAASSNPIPAAPGPMVISKKPTALRVENSSVAQCCKRKLGKEAQNPSALISKEALKERCKKLSHIETKGSPAKIVSEEHQALMRDFDAMAVQNSSRFGQDLESGSRSSEWSDGDAYIPLPELATVSLVTAAPTAERRVKAAEGILEAAPFQASPELECLLRSSIEVQRSYINNKDDDAWSGSASA